MPTGRDGMPKGRMGNGTLSVPPCVRVRPDAPGTYIIAVEDGIWTQKDRGGHKVKKRITGKQRTGAGTSCEGEGTLMAGRARAASRLGCEGWAAGSSNIQNAEGRSEAETMLHAQ